MLPKNLPPPHPGEIIDEEFLKPLQISQAEFARRCGFGSHRPINEIIKKKRGISSEMALILHKALGPSPELWLNLQQNWGLWHTIHSEKAQRRLTRVKAVGRAIHS